MSALREFSSGSRFIFWALAPFLILFAVIMPLTTEHWDAVQIVLVVVMDAAALLLVLGLYDPRRSYRPPRGVLVGFRSVGAVRHRRSCAQPTLATDSYSSFSGVRCGFTRPVQSTYPSWFRWSPSFLNSSGRGLPSSPIMGVSMST